MGGPRLPTPHFAPGTSLAGGRYKERTRRVRRASNVRLYLLERETGLEPATACLEGRPILDRSLAPPANVRRAQEATGLRKAGRLCSSAFPPIACLDYTILA